MARHMAMLWEVFRKTAHFAAIIILVFYTLLLNYFTERDALFILTTILLILLQIEHIRLEHKPNIIRFVDSIFRQREKNALSAAAFMLIAAILCFASFEYWIAFLAMLMTVFGDMFAALFGRMFGRIKIVNQKTIIGTAAGFAANLAVGFLVLPDYWFITLPVAFTASAIELFTNKLDDNLTVPVFAGFVGQIIFYISQVPLPPVDFSFWGLFNF